MAHFPTKVYIITAILILGTACFAQESSCDKALVIATYQRFSSNNVDWRLASLVTSDTYDEITHNGTLDTVIYGVPTKGGYNDYHNRVEQALNSLNMSFTHQQAENVAWTGLDPNATTAYSDCLQTQALRSGGLHLAVKSATSRDVAVLVRWFPQGGHEQSTIPVSWQGITVNYARQDLPTSIPQGDTYILIARPSEQRSLVVNGSGFADVVTITPYPPPPPPLPSFETKISLSADGFPHWKTGSHQVPGCGCGQSSVLFYEGASGPDSNTTTISGVVGTPIAFRWDAAWICQGQGIKGYPNNIGTMDFGDGTTTAELPEYYGVAHVSYPASKDYIVKVDVSATCYDTGAANCSNTCSASGSVRLSVSRPSQ